MKDELYYEKLEAKYNHDDYEYEETEIKTCKGDMCSNYVEEDEDELCSECQHLMQRCLSEWLSNFNEYEKSYIIEYIKESEV